MRNFIIFYLFFGFSVACFAQNNAVLPNQKFVSTNCLTSNIMLNDKQSYSIEKDALSAIYTINKDTASYLYKVRVQPAFYGVFIFKDLTYGAGFDFHFRTKESRHSWGLGSSLTIGRVANLPVYLYYAYGGKKSFIEAGWLLNYYGYSVTDASPSHSFSKSLGGYQTMPYLGYRYQPENSNFFLRAYFAPYFYQDLVVHAEGWSIPMPPNFVANVYSRNYQIKSIERASGLGFGISAGYTLSSHF